MNMKNYTCLHIVPARRQVRRRVARRTPRRSVFDLPLYLANLLFRRSA